MLVIGDRINGTVGAVRIAIAEKDGAFIAGLAAEQAAAGADYIDVNVGSCEGESEEELMKWALEVVRGATDRPLSLDSSDPRVLARGLEILGETGQFINSVTGDRERMDAVLPLAAEFECPVVALAMDESGIPKTARARLAVCIRIMERSVELGIPESNVFFDPLVLPVSIDHEQGRITLETLTLVKSELPGSRTVLGLSNVSFGLPHRSLLNKAMVSAAVYLGLDAALLDPTDAGLMAAAIAAEAVSGRDPFCRGYIKSYRSGSLG